MTRIVQVHLVNAMCPGSKFQTGFGIHRASRGGFWLFSRCKAFSRLFCLVPMTTCSFQKWFLAWQPVPVVTPFSELRDFVDETQKKRGSRGYLLVSGVLPFRFFSVDCRWPQLLQLRTGADVCTLSASNQWTSGRTAFQGTETGRKFWEPCGPCCWVYL